MVFVFLVICNHVKMELRKIHTGQVEAGGPFTEK